MKNLSTPRRLQSVRTNGSMAGMEHKVDFQKKKPNDELTIGDIRLYKLFPWARNYRTIAKIIREDQAGENVLKARIEGEGRQARYYIKAKNLIKYLNKYGSAFMMTIRKYKNNK